MGALREAKLPKFCGSKFYFTLYFTKGIGEAFMCALMIIITFLALPVGVYLLLPFEKTPEKFHTLFLCLTFFVIIVLVFFIYKLIGDATKHKQKDMLLSIRSLKDQIDSNKKQIRKIARSIRKDKNEDMYNLEDYDEKMKDIENDIAIITQNKADALKVFDDTTKPAIIAEIEGRELPRIEALEKKFKEVSCKLTDTEDTVKQLGIKISTEYESYLDKSFSNVEKIDELMAIMENRGVATIGEAIQIYKNKA